MERHASQNPPHHAPRLQHLSDGPPEKWPLTGDGPAIFMKHRIWSNKQKTQIVLKKLSGQVHITKFFQEYQVSQTPRATSDVTPLTGLFRRGGLE